MYCSNCGKENDKNNNFCINCGKKLNYSQNIKQSDGNKETSLVLGIICLISSFFISILCFIPGIISIVYAKKYKKESGKLGVGFGLSLGGMIFSLIMFIITIFLVLFIIGIVNETNNKYGYNIEYTYYLPSK